MSNIYSWLIGDGQVAINYAAAYLRAIIPPERSIYSFEINTATDTLSH